MKMLILAALCVGLAMATGKADEQTGPAEASLTGQVVKPEAGNAHVFTDECECWIDVKTGKPVATMPLSGINISGKGQNVEGYDASGGVAMIDGSDPSRAFNAQTGQNFLRQPDDCWIDVKTGKPVATVPLSGINISGKGQNVEGYDASGGVAMIDSSDPTRASNAQTGQNFVRVPCPPPATTTPPPAPTPTPTPPLPVEHASSGLPARFDLGLGYSYMHADDEVVQDLNGFTVSGFYNVNPWFALGGEFSGLYGTENQGFSGSATSFSEKTSLDRYLYLFGPQVTWHPCEHSGVFGHVLVGGVHDEIEVNETETAGSIVTSSSTHSTADALALDVGAGFEVQVTRHFSVGPTFDYVPTHITSSSGNHWQNKWRAGVAGNFSF